MRSRILAAAALVAVLASYAPVLAQAVPTPRRSHGVNLANGLVFADNAEVVFADLVRGSSLFNGYRGVAPTPQYDAAGWPTRVDATTGTTTLVLALNAPLPAGDYTVTAKGTGTFTIGGTFTGSNAQGISTLKFIGDGKPQILKRTSSGVPFGAQLVLTMTASSAADPLREISFVLPGHVGKTFYEPFLNDLRPFEVFRTMDWQVTNGSKMVEWSDWEKTRTKFSVQQNGRVGEETAIELANILDKDLWICIPALASDDYIKKLAALFDSKLEPERGLYVEFSNEVWGAFPQNAQLGIEREKRPQFPLQVPSKPGVPSTPVTGGWEYMARRDGNATNLFKASLKPGRKCIRVLARQAGYPATITNAMAQYKADGYGFDAISATCYFGQRGVDMDAAATLFKTDPEAALAQVFKGMDAAIAEFITGTGYLAWWKQQADANKVPLMCYEGGQHLNASAGNDGPTAMLMAAQRDPRMAAAYKKVIDGLPPGTGPICWFNSCGTWSKWGFWGLKERTGQANSQAIKYATVLADIIANPPPPPPPETLPPLSLPVTGMLNWLKALGIDGYVKVGSDGAYTATLWDPRPSGFQVQKLVVPTPAPAPVPTSP